MYLLCKCKNCSLYIMLKLADQKPKNHNKWSNFDERPHCYLVTSRSGEWIRPTLTPSNTWFHTNQPLKRHLDRFTHFCTVHPCAQRTQSHIPRYLWHLCYAWHCVWCSLQRWYYPPSHLNVNVMLSNIKDLSKVPIGLPPIGLPNTCGVG